MEFISEHLVLEVKIADKYWDVAPTVVIEVDTKADVEDFDSALNYYHLKTEKLLNFGVERVIWIVDFLNRNL